MNILFTCVGRRTYLLKYFRENMNPEDRIIATDMNPSAPALQAADTRIIVPAVYTEDYVDRILGICREYDVRAVISLNDLELPVLSENKERFGSIGVTLIVSSPGVIDICFDKYKTAQWVASLGLKAPRTFVRLEEAKAALSAGEIGFPLFLKPRWGSGSIGLESVDDEEELVFCYHMLAKKIKRSVLATASVGDEFIMIQETLTGREYGLDVMNDLKGNNVGVSVKQKLAMRAGETDKAVTVDIPEIGRIGRLLGENLHHVGNLDVDIMQRADGEYCVLELNPRFGGGFPFSYEAGVNLPLAILRWLRGETVDPSILVPEYGKTFAKNDYLVEVG